MNEFVNPNAVEFEDNDEESTNLSYDASRLSQAVVTATDWTTETIIGQLKRGNILLTPRFQRRDAWTKPRKSKFIESIILGLPIPQVVLAEHQEQRGKYIVLDGKQRLLSLLQFVGAGIGKNNNFALTSLDVLKELEKKTWSEIENDLLYSSLITSFQNHTIRAVVIRNWPDENFLYLVFRRLNTGSVSLSPQELRQALFPGKFTDFLDERAINSKPLKKLLDLNEPDFRMRDLELLLRHLAFSNFITEYNGNLKAFLDGTCEKLNRVWDTQQEQISSQIDSFEEGTLSAIKVFGLHDVAHKPKDSSTRRRFNKAIFDVLVFYFADETIRNAAEKNPERVRQVFMGLWQTHGNREKEDFVRSVELSTKSINAMFTRFSVWGKILRDCLSLDFNVPDFDASNNRIIFNRLWSD